MGRYWGLWIQSGKAWEDLSGEGVGIWNPEQLLETNEGRCGKRRKTWEEKEYGKRRQRTEQRALLELSPRAV